MAGRPRSIAVPILALVIASVLVATAISFAVTFSGPPPDGMHGIDGIAAALRAGKAPERAGPPIRIVASATPPVPMPDERADPVAASRLAAALGVPASEVVAYTPRPDDGPPGSFPHDFTFGWHTGHGWRNVERLPPPLFTEWHWKTLGAMIAAMLALSLPAWLLARALSRPLAQLAEAADRAGTGARLPPLPGGWREVRDLAAAVRTMHARLASHAEGRTAMLAGMAHDLGTPLSRIAFRLEGLPEEARARAAADIAEMRAMIAATLAFARDEAEAPISTRLDLGSLLDSLAEDIAEAGEAVTLDPGPRAVVRGDPGALRRLFANLVDNAVRYGGGATIAWHVSGSSVAVCVDDDGPGVDAATAERLFQPFVRGDPSRNRETGGTGLGLAIVRGVATRHGGAVTLQNRPGGTRGARARVVLPLAS